jgi:sugar/nucleoside kinase (ribokinase family)
MGGKGFNQAVAAALATGGGSKGKVSFYGTVGEDDAGKGLKEKLLSKWGLNNDTLFQDPMSCPAMCGTIHGITRTDEGDWEGYHSSW